MRTKKQIWIGRLNCIWISIVMAVVTIVLVTLNSPLFLLPYKHRRALLDILRTSKIWFSCAVILCFNVFLSIEGKSKIKTCKKKTFVIISNHLSFTDIPILAYIYDYSFIFKSSLLKTPFGWGAWLLGGIKINQNTIKGLKSTIKQCKHRIKNNNPFFLFPEGTRGTPDKILPFKRILLNFLYDLKAPVLVMGIYGTQHIIPRKELLVFRSKKVGASVYGFIYPEEHLNLQSFITACEEATKISVHNARNLIQ